MMQSTENQNHPINTASSAVAAPPQHDVSQPTQQRSVQVTQHNLNQELNNQTAQAIPKQSMHPSQPPASTQQTQSDNERDAVTKPTTGSKKKSRKRMTNAETHDFRNRCVVLYREGKASKLIAYMLGVRESKVKDMIYDFVHHHPGQVIQAKISLAAPDTRIRDITGKDDPSGHYEAIQNLDGTYTLKPITSPHTA